MVSLNDSVQSLNLSEIASNDSIVEIASEESVGPEGDGHPRNWKSKKEIRSVRRRNSISRLLIL